MLYLALCALFLHAFLLTAQNTSFIDASLERKTRAHNALDILNKNSQSVITTFMTLPATHWKPIHKIPLTSTPYKQLQLSRDGSCLVVTDATGMHIARKDDVDLWHIETLPVRNIQFIAIDHSGTCIARATKDKRVQVFRYDTNKHRWGSLQFPFTAFTTPQETSESHVTGLRMNTAGSRILVSDEKNVYSSVYTDTTQAWESPKLPVMTCSGDISALAMSDDGLVIAAISTDKTLQIAHYDENSKAWNVKSVNIPARERNTCSHIALSPDKETVITTSNRGLELFFINVPTGKVHTVEGTGGTLRSITIAPSNTHACIQRDDALQVIAYDTAIKAWRLLPGCTVTARSVHQKEITACALAPHNNTLVWSTPDNRLHYTSIDVAARKQTTQLVMPFHKKITQLAVNDTSSMIAVQTNDDIQILACPLAFIKKLKMSHISFLHDLLTIGKNFKAHEKISFNKNDKEQAAQFDLIVSLPWQVTELVQDYFKLTPEQKKTLEEAKENQLKAALQSKSPASPTASYKPLASAA